MPNDLVYNLFPSIDRPRVIFGTRDRAPVFGTYTPRVPYRVFPLIRNPAASNVARDPQLSRGALKVVQ